MVSYGEQLIGARRATPVLPECCQVSLRLPKPPRRESNVSASVPANPTWSFTPLKADRLRQIAGRLAVGIEDDVVDDEAIGFALDDCRILPPDPTHVVLEKEMDEDPIPPIAQHSSRAKRDRRRRPVRRAREDTTVDEGRFVNDLWDRRVHRRRVWELPNEVRLTRLSIVDSPTKIFA